MPPTRRLLAAAVLGLSVTACQTPATPTELLPTYPVTASPSSTPTATPTPSPSATAVRVPATATHAALVIPRTAARVVPRTTTLPKPQTAVQRPAVPKPAAPKPAAYFANCTQMRAAGVAPLPAGAPGYRAALDRDRDGFACETD